MSVNRDNIPSAADSGRRKWQSPPTAKRPHHDSDSSQDSSSEDDSYLDPKRMKGQLGSQKDAPQKSTSTASEPAKKISFGLAQKPTGGTKIGFGSFKMGLNKTADKVQPSNISGKSQSSAKPVAKAKVAAAFDDDEDEEEEMPPEAKMRMKNIGRETPTSAGPNSFGKFRMGFCDAKKMFERQLKEAQED